MNFLERLKLLCDKKGVSQRKLERDLGFSNGSSSKWSKSSPSGDVLQKIADYFGVSIDYLMGRSPDNDILGNGPREEINLDNAFKSVASDAGISSDDLKRILEIIKSTKHKNK